MTNGEVLTKLGQPYALAPRVSGTAVRSHARLLEIGSG